MIKKLDHWLLGYDENDFSLWFVLTQELCCDFIFIKLLSYRGSYLSTQRLVCWSGIFSKIIAIVIRECMGILLWFKIISKTFLTLLPPWRETDSSGLHMYGQLRFSSKGQKKAKLAHLFQSLSQAEQWRLGLSLVSCFLCPWRKQKRGSKGILATPCVEDKNPSSLLQSSWENHLGRYPPALIMLQGLKTDQPT